MIQADVYRYQFDQYFEAHNIDKLNHRHRTNNVVFRQSLNSLFPIKIFLVYQCYIIHGWKT